MPLKNLLRNVVFEPETAQLLASAVENAWESLKASGDPLAANGNAAETRTLLAKRVIELAQQGERNADRLRDQALARVRAGDPNR
jgi:hypothetical protein